MRTGHANVWYLERIEDIVKNGERVEARNRVTYEVLHEVTELPDPRKRVLTVPFRRSNPFFQAMECVWILAGRSDAQWITRYNKQLKSFLDPLPASYYPDDGRAVPLAEHFHAPYGERLRRWGSHDKLHIDPSDSLMAPVDQLRDVVTQLTADPGSRRAVAVLHIPYHDNPRIETKDRPCNIAVSYQLRGGKLWAATFNRSNDLNLGLAFTNLAQFTSVQEALAVALGAGVGTYTHFSSSLHVYTDDPIVHRLSELRRRTFDFDVYQHVDPTAMELGDNVWKYVEALAQATTGEEFRELIDDITCPYWRSAARMGAAWSALYDDDADEPGLALGKAMSHVVMMECPDWQASCLEFLFRWALNRHLHDQFLGSLRLLDREGDLKLAEPIFRFVTHDVEEAA